MKRINLISLAVVLVSGLLLLNNAYADTLTVGPEGSSANFTSIQAAIAAASDGDTIEVMPGEYLIDEQIDIGNNLVDVIIKSQQGAEETILLASENLNGILDHVFLIMTGTSNITIEGFTIAAVPESTGFNGIRCVSGTDTTISNNVIQGNNGGWGIFGDGSTIYPNFGATLSINNNVISGFDIGILIQYDSSAEIVNNTIYAISEDNLKGIFVYESSAEIVNNTVSGHVIGVTIMAHSTAEIVNCIIYNSSTALFQGNFSPVTITYSNIQGGCAGEGNIDVDPLFVNPAGDFHLQSDSPCIDTGDPSYLYVDPDYSRNDMGAYGGLGAYRYDPPIKITFPENGQFLNSGNEQVVAWVTTPVITSAAMNEDINVRIIVSHLVRVGTTKEKAIDLEVIVPNTGSYALPIDTLRIGIEYTLDLSVAIGDEVNFQTE